MARPNERTNTLCNCKGGEAVAVAVAAQSLLLFLAKKHAFRIPQAAAAAATPHATDTITRRALVRRKNERGNDATEGGGDALSHDGGKR